MVMRAGTAFVHYGLLPHSIDLRGVQTEQREFLNRGRPRTVPQINDPLYSGEFNPFFLPQGVFVVVLHVPVPCEERVWLEEFKLFFPATGFLLCVARVSSL